ncbi:MAG: hypothetical protein RL264_3152 [Bacteroidota bacterium]|jgi:transcription antitermination factor NusG
MKVSKLKFWFVVKTASKSEKKVNERLIHGGFITFLPMYESIRVWSDRKKKIFVPLIPSTLFVNCSFNEINKIYTFQGVVGVLRFLNKPAIVKDWEIQNLKILLNELNGHSIETANEIYEPGDFVEVVRGPLKGLYGVSVNIQGKHRLVIRIESISIAYLVSVPFSFVRKIVEQKIV